MQNPDRLGVCFDTCHVFAAGYQLATQSGYLATMHEFDRIVGVGQVPAFHLNNSLREMGSRVDRHAHIGQGKIGLEGFRADRSRPPLSPHAHVFGNPQGHKRQPRVGCDQSGHATGIVTVQRTGQARPLRGGIPVQPA